MRSALKLTFLTPCSLSSFFFFSLIKGLDRCAPDEQGGVRRRTSEPYGNQFNVTAKDCPFRCSTTAAPASWSLASSRYFVKRLMPSVASSPFGRATVLDRLMRQRR